MRPQLPPLALIAGPTASGKSALALALAERSGGVLVNADSAQVYRDLKILSAGPSDDELARAEHRLYGTLDGAQPCSAADWAVMARREIEDIQASGRLPILVGGTGTLSAHPARRHRARPSNRPGNPASRARGRRGGQSCAIEIGRPRSCRSVEALGHNTRIARALEVVLSTGRTLAEWQQEREGGIGDQVELRPLILLPPRPWLHERCDARFADMMEHGAVEEVRALLSRNLDPALPVMRAIGVREIAAYVRGEIDRAEAIALGQQATRQYAKRQYTWFKHQPPPDWPRFELPLEQDTIGAALELLSASA